MCASAAIQDQVLDSYGKKLTSPIFEQCVAVGFHTDFVDNIVANCDEPA
jgi:hypothetical protein